MASNQNAPCHCGVECQDIKPTLILLAYIEPSGFVPETEWTPHGSRD